MALRSQSSPTTPDDSGRAGVAISNLGVHDWENVVGFGTRWHGFGRPSTSAVLARGPFRILVASQLRALPPCSRHLPAAVGSIEDGGPPRSVEQDATKKSKLLSHTMMHQQWFRRTHRANRWAFAWNSSLAPFWAAGRPCLVIFDILGELVLPNIHPKSRSRIVLICLRCVVWLQNAAGGSYAAVGVQASDGGERRAGGGSCPPSSCLRGCHV